MFSDSVRRFLLLGSLGTGLLIVPIGSIAADEYRCELYVKKFVSPIFQGCSLISETNPNRLYTEFMEYRDGKDYRETQEYPHGSCFDMLRGKNETAPMLKKQAEEFLTKYVKPEQIFVYVFDTENKNQPVRKMEIKKGNDVTWLPFEKEMRREYQGRYTIKTKGDMLLYISGNLDSGNSLSLRHPKNWWDYSSGKVRDDLVSRPLQDKRTLIESGRFGALYWEGTCLNQKMIAD